MRLPVLTGVMRTTISWVNPIQRLHWLASIRPDDLSDATIVHPILLGDIERSSKCRIGRQPEGQWYDIWVSSSLLFSDLGAFVEPTGLTPSPCRSGTTATKAGGLLVSVVMS